MSTSKPTLRMTGAWYRTYPVARVCGDEPEGKFGQKGAHERQAENPTGVSQNI